MSDRCAASALLTDAVRFNIQFPLQLVSDKRVAAVQHWSERKRMLDPAWRTTWASLPPHVQSVLGPKKNLLLLAEMLDRAGSPDTLLVPHLTFGFPLIGQLPRSGTLRSVPYADTTETRTSLLQAAPRRNQIMEARFLASSGRDRCVAYEFDRQSLEEVAAGKAEVVDKDSYTATAVLTPRFPCDEGWKLKRGTWTRKVRVIDDFHASRVNDAVSVGEAIAHDTLDALVVMLQQMVPEG